MRVLKPSVLLAVTGLALAGLLVTACSPSRSVKEEGRVDNRLDEVWRAAGVNPKTVDVQGYEFKKHPGARPCNGIADEGRHWFATRKAILPAGALSQAEVVTRVEQMLAHTSYKVSSYRASGSGDRLLKARSREKLTYVELRVHPDGSARLKVMRTPCAGMVNIKAGPPFEPDKQS